MRLITLLLLAVAEGQQGMALAELEVLGLGPDWQLLPEQLIR
jgi:hypothetical protein